MSLLERIIFCSGGIAFIFTAISWISFARLSMARMERDMKADGLPRPCPWDGPGVRVLWIARAISVPVGWFNSAGDPSIDVLTVRKYATANDKKRAIAVMISGYSFVLVVFSAAALGIV
ncbi:MAG: hypothetical protein P8077_06105 [Gammaproteobacteria bacterium]